MLGDCELFAKMGSSYDWGATVFELNRNHFFAAGLILILMGVQLRYIESYRLTAESTRFIKERIEKKKTVEPQAPLTAFIGAPPIADRRVIKPPRWAGWSLMSLGAVLVLHSLALKKPG